jgi:hypothetical protein
MIKVSDIGQDREHADIPGDWHFKVSLLDSRLMERFKAAVTLGSKISYDEIMPGFRGRSPDVTKVPGKPVPNGFKVWAFCDHGYIYDWLYFSGSAGTLFHCFSLDDAVVLVGMLAVIYRTKSLGVFDFGFGSDAPNLIK